MRNCIFLIKSSENSICPVCGHPLEPRDRVKRILRSRNSEVKWLGIRRLKCINPDCRRLHRELPDILVPFKHYESEIISGVLDGFITPDTIGFQDNPSDRTMRLWQYWLRANKNRIDGTLKSIGYQRLGFSEELLTSGVSLLYELQRTTADWLRIILRFIYNSGASLESVWAL